MVRILVLAVFLLAGSVIGASETFADEADCWRSIKESNRLTDELGELTQRHRETKTEETRCAMLSKTREAILQKIEMSKVCTPYVPNTETNIAKAKQDLKLLDSPKLKCSASKPLGAQAPVDKRDEACLRAGDEARQAEERSGQPYNGLSRQSPPSQICAFITATETFVTMSLRWSDRCRHMDPSKADERRASLLKLRADIAPLKKEFANICRQFAREKRQ